MHISSPLSSSVPHGRGSGTKIHIFICHFSRFGTKKSAFALLNYRDLCGILQTIGIGEVSEVNPILKTIGGLTPR